MHTAFPNRRTLLMIWGLLVLLTIGTMIAGRVNADIELGIVWLVALCIITWAKAILILRYYLNLQASDDGWNKAFNVFLFVLLALVLGIFAVSASLY